MSARRASKWLAIQLATLIAGCAAGGASLPPAPSVPRASASASASGPCGDFERDVERVWSAARKAEVSAAFVKLGVDYADRVVERVTTKMDDLTANWVMLSERLCKDYLVRKLLTREEYTARSACFDSALIRQRTFARMLATPNKGYAAHALGAFEEISDKLEECQSRAAWAPYAREQQQQQQPPPRAIEDGAQVEDLAAEAVLAVKLGDPTRAERAAERAVALAGTSGSERALLDSLLASALVDVQRARFASARDKLTRAIAQANALHAQLALALAHQYQGQLEHEQHRDGDAIAAFQRALELRRALLPADDPQVAWTLDNLGAAYHALGDDRRAIALHEEALAIYRRRSDAREASISDALSNLGLAWAGLGEHERAIAHYERALAIDQPSVRDDRPSVADTFQNLGLSYRERRDFARAQSAFERAIAIYRAAYGDGTAHPRLTRALYGLGSTHLRAGRYAPAASVLQQCTAALAAGDPLLPSARNDLGFALGELGEHERALREFEQVLALRTSAPATPATELGDSHANLGIALRRAGRAERAIEALQQALALYRNALGDADPRVLHMLEELGAAYQRLGDCTRARDALVRARTLAASTLGPAAAHTQQLAAALAGVCAAGRRL